MAVPGSNDDVDDAAVLADGRSGTAATCMILGGGALIIAIWWTVDDFRSDRTVVGGLWLAQLAIGLAGLVAVVVGAVYFALVVRAEAAADTGLRQQEWLAQYGRPVTATVERIAHRGGTSHLVVRCYDPTTGLSHDFEHRLVDARIPVSAGQQLQVRVDPDDYRRYRVLLD